MGAVFLERCVVASSPFPLISEPCFHHRHADAALGLAAVIPRCNPPPPVSQTQINKAVFASSPNAS